MSEPRNATEIRQGERDRRVAKVLGASIVIALVLATSAIVYVMTTPKDEIAEEPVRVIGDDNG